MSTKRKSIKTKYPESYNERIGGNAATDMRVILTHPDPNYSIGESNPAVNSPWECTGTIVCVDRYNEITVKWDNGYSNIYKNNELSISHDGQCIPIW